MIIFYKGKNKAKIYLTKHKQCEEKFIIFSNCDSFFEYIESQQDLLPKSKLFYCDNKLCLLIEGNRQGCKICKHIKAHLFEYGLLISCYPYTEIRMALKKIKGL